MDEISVDSAFISDPLCRITDKPERGAMIDVAIGSVGNIDFGGLQDGQQFTDMWALSEARAAGLGYRTLWYTNSSKSRSVRMAPSS
jgi:hypothetical protein